jgi:hypothetical protein
VEGIVGDLAHGHIPNIPGELGVRAEWEHNRKGLITFVVGAALTSAAIVCLRNKKEES